MSRRRGCPAREIRFRNVTFKYPVGEGGHPVFLDRLRPDDFLPAGSSLAIVGQNGAGKTTLAKLLCRLYDPQKGAIEIDGVDLREIDIDAWRGRVTAVFQDFIRFELPLRDNVAPSGMRPTASSKLALAEAGCGTPGKSRHDSRAWLRGRDGLVGRSVAEGRARAGDVRGKNGRGIGVARRADGAARRAGRGGNFRACPEGDVREGATVTILDLSPVLDGSSCGTGFAVLEQRPGDRARHAR